MFTLLTGEAVAFPLLNGSQSIWISGVGNEVDGGLMARVSRILGCAATGSSKLGTAWVSLIPLAPLSLVGFTCNLLKV